MEYGLDLVVHLRLRYLWTTALREQEFSAMTSGPGILQSLQKFHTLPSDAKVRRLYEKLIRNENLKLNAQHTRICGDHFPDGERMCRTQLPSIFPWTATPEKR